MDHSLTVEIPLAAEQALAAFDALRPDPELKPQEFSKHIELVGDRFVATFEGTTERTLRVGVNSFMDSLIEVLECIAAFDPAYFKA